MRHEYRKKTRRGQAVIEYVIVFAIVCAIAVGFVKGLQSTFAGSIGGLAIALTKQLNSGVCRNTCYFDSYKNSINPDGFGP